jgi:hypothetical protein
MHYPKNLGATLVVATYSASVVDYAIEEYLREDPTNKRRSKKMTRTKGAFLINSTTHKISIRKANKIKR